MGMFDSKSQAKAFREGGGANFAPGQYIVKINACKFFEGNSGPTFVVEATVLGVSSNDPAAPQPGDDVSSVWSQGAEGWMKEKFMTRWWAFMEASTGDIGSGYNDGDWKAASDRALAEPTSSLEGTVIAAKGWAKTVGGYCNVKWFGAPTPDQYAVCGIEPGAAPGPAPAAAAPEPLQDKAADGRVILSHDGGTSWSYA